VTLALIYVIGLVQAATAAWLLYERQQRAAAAKQQAEHRAWLKSLGSRADQLDAQATARLRDCDQLYQATGRTRQAK
jgi:Xaa-Pro aminopeptidase